MNYESLRQQISSLSENERNLYQPVLSLASLGGSILPEFQQCLDQANNYKEFFERIYESDNLKLTKAWGAYARAMNKNWLERFTPLSIVRNCSFDGCSLLVSCGEGSVAIPLRGHGKIANVVVFEDDHFNRDTARYFSTLSGKFSCCELSFDGIYDVYTSKNTVVFEKWVLNDKGQRVKAADLALKYRKAA